MSNIFNGFIEFVTALLLFYGFFGHETCGILVPPDQGSNLHPPTLEGEVLTTGWNPIAKYY